MTLLAGLHIGVSVDFMRTAGLGQLADLTECPLLALYGLPLLGPKRALNRCLNRAHLLGKIIPYL